ncbi:MULTISPECIES: hypothetical protein [Aerococcus]|uniref:Uncharacterized protein n=1 Tax=Aerococcus sanguinicola TaxID=119206 RepID=A0A5N1GLB1_9LACT|nr:MULTISPECIES: hypothetical protein [Aerococcus]KAA9301767.1 hypothetical protein F6I03_00750 [Aerococcus sanguinicola]MDK6368817.1 hypothetical protein [Aerococcus sp. UMB9870]MDK6679416.1 hypothetical protein [Aerococcus sp. UMB8608]MDK6685740.1 hypothetical protein [Aerococcus sp. UMB8623]MDK6939441.1 hypothetical protein [Aerococcus sp. UMB8487]
MFTALKKACLLNQEDLIPIRPYQTLSKIIAQSKEWSLVLLSLAEETDISGESYPSNKLYFCINGQVQIANQLVEKGQAVLYPKNKAIAIEAVKDSIIFEFTEN